MTLPLGIAIVASTLIVGSLLYVLVARWSPHGGREQRTPTSVYAVTAGAMSLLIAFTMSMTYGEYLDAQSSAEAEADAVMSMSRAATFMKPEMRDALRNQLACYSDQVVTISWPAVRNGATQIQPEIMATLNTMDGILAADPAGAGAGLDLWEEANSQRLAAHMQMLQVAGDGVPPILWLLLIAGSVITIGSLVVYADRSKPAWGHVLVIIGPLFIASAALVVIAFFDHPYMDTPGAVSPHAMELVYQRLTESQVPGIPLAVCPKGA